MSETSPGDMEPLRTRARQRIAEGRLPRIKAVRTWGGMGSGLSCALCDAAITGSEPEFELQFDLSAPAQSVRLHRECHSAWCDVRDEFQPTEWHLVAQQLPPLGAVVEARVSFGETRSLILSAIWTKDALAGAHGWINPMTGGPLPEGWRPIEWRHSPGRGAEPEEGSSEPPASKRA